MHFLSHTESAAFTSLCLVFHKQMGDVQSARINRLNFPFEPASGLAAQVGLLEAKMGGYRGALYPEIIATGLGQTSQLCRNMDINTVVLRPL